MNMSIEDIIAYRKAYGDRAYKQFVKSQRVTNGMNTGTISMKSNRDYNRAEGKRICANYN